jgi:hypothetical protein
VIEKAAKAPKKKALCNTCTIMLVRKAYERAWWFRLIREPLSMAMVIMGKLYRVNPGDYDVRSPECLRCRRFIKLGLKEKSRFFVWLNDRINPAFDRIIDGLVTGEVLEESKRYAKEKNPDRQ